MALRPISLEMQIALEENVQAFSDALVAEFGGGRAALRSAILSGDQATVGAATTRAMTNGALQAVEALGKAVYFEALKRLAAAE